MVLRMVLLVVLCFLRSSFAILLFFFVFVCDLGTDTRMRVRCHVIVLLYDAYGIRGISRDSQHKRRKTGLFLDVMMHLLTCQEG